MLVTCYHSMITAKFQFGGATILCVSLRLQLSDAAGSKAGRTQFCLLSLPSFLHLCIPLRGNSGWGCSQLLQQFYFCAVVLLCLPELLLSAVDFTWQTGKLSFSPYLFCSAEPPKFVKKPEALRFVKQGDTVQLECKISGTPEIRIVWYKNDQALQASDRLHMSFVDSVAMLTILGATAEDAGDYICEAHNSAGTASCSTSVTVKG